MTQGRQLIEALKLKPHTYGEMMAVMRWKSCSPWKRVTESLRGTETLVKGKRYMGDGEYLTTWKVVQRRLTLPKGGL